MYEIVLKKPAIRFLKKLSKYERQIIIKKIKDLKQNPRLGKPLMAGLSRLWSLRIGKHRLVYQIIENKLIIYVLNIEHRKNIYQ